VFSEQERRTLYQLRSCARSISKRSTWPGGSSTNASMAADPLDRALYQDIMMYLPDDILALTDRVGMWHSLELRVPFVDTHSSSSAPGSRLGTSYGGDRRST
jgi:Asparagine synthase